MWGDFLSFMKKQNLKYTEYSFYISDNSPLGWLKIVLACILLRPIRLVNEIGKKLFFLGKDSLLYVLRVSLLLDILLLLSNLLESFLFEHGQKTYIPFSVLCFCAIAICLFYWKVYTLDEYNFKIMENKEDFSEEKSDLDTFTVSQENVTVEEVFEDISADNVLFDDPINIFIQDPDELENLGIHPATYFDKEEDRLLNAIDKSTSVFDNDFIDLSNDEVLYDSDQIVDIMDELQKQLQCG